MSNSNRHSSPSATFRVGALGGWRYREVGAICRANALHDPPSGKNLAKGSTRDNVPPLRFVGEEIAGESSRGGSGVRDHVLELRFEGFIRLSTERQEPLRAGQAEVGSQRS